MKDPMQLVLETNCRERLEKATTELHEALKEQDFEGALDCADQLDMLILMLEREMGKDASSASVSAISNARVAQAAAETAVGFNGEED